MNFVVLLTFAVVIVAKAQVDGELPVEPPVEIPPVKLPKVPVKVPPVKTPPGVPPVKVPPVKTPPEVPPVKVPPVKTPPGVPPVKTPPGVPPVKVPPVKTPPEVPPVKVPPVKPPGKTLPGKAPSDDMEAADGTITVLPKVPLPKAVSPVGHLLGITPDPTCLLNQCGPPLGVFTNYCNVLCIASGFGSGKCNYILGQPQCLCGGGKGNLSFLLGINCDLLCTIGCNTCGYKKSKCSIPLTAKNSVRCTCSQK